MSDQILKNSLETLHNALQEPLTRLVETRTDLFVHDQDKPDPSSLKWIKWDKRLKTLREKCIAHKHVIDQAIAGLDLPNAAKIELQRHVEDCIITEAHDRATSGVATERAQIAMLSFYEKTQTRAAKVDDNKASLEAAHIRRLYTDVRPLGI